MKFLNSDIGRLRLIAFLEGISFIVLLFIAMPLKYMADEPQMVKIVGGIHGLLFVLFIIFTMVVWLGKKLTFMKSFWLFLSSLVPFGTFLADIRILKPIHHSTLQS